MAVEIRLATLADYHPICTLIAQIDAQHRVVHPDQFRAAQPVRELAFLQSWLDDADRHVWVAEENGAIVGTVWFLVRSTPDMPILVPRTFIHIDTLVVDEHQRRKGIGQALMAAVHQWGRKHGINEIELGVWAFNESAIDFYRRLGYEILYHRMHRNLAPHDTDLPLSREGQPL